MGDNGSEDESHKGHRRQMSSGGLCYGPFVLLLIIGLLFAVLYASFNFRLVSRSEEAAHEMQLRLYKKEANEARKELAQWKRGIEEKDIVVRELEYKVATAKKSRDEYLEALKIKDKQLSQLAGHPNPRG